VLEALLLVAICLLPVLVYLPVLRTPFVSDEGVYATIAQGLLDGKIPYRDLFDNKPPLIYGWYAFSFLLFGESVVAPRIVAALLLSFTTLSLFGQVRMVLPGGVAYVAAGLFALSTGLPFVALHANTEAYMLLPLVTSLAAFTIGMRRGRLGWFLLAGALGALAMMTKQVAVWNLLALAAVATWWRWRDSGCSWRSVTPALCLIAGAAATTALIVLPFAGAGALSDFLYANLSYNWLYVGVLSVGERLVHLGQGVLYFTAVAGPLIAGAVLGLVSLLRGEKRPLDYLLILWALASVVGVVSGGRFFPHYFLHLLPAMAVLAAVVVYNRFSGGQLRPIWKPGLVLGLLLVVMSLVTNGALYLAPKTTEKRVAEVVLERKQWESDSLALAAYIAQRTNPDDTIFNFGREAQIYFYSDRRPAVRYFSDWPYWWDQTTLTETIEALRTVRPTYIIDSAQPPLFDYGPYHPPVFRDFLSQNYEYVGRVYFADVYRLKEHS